MHKSGDAIRGPVWLACLARDPQGRFATDACSWLAAVVFGPGDLGEALRHQPERLDLQPTREVRVVCPIPQVRAFHFPEAPIPGGYKRMTPLGSSVALKPGTMTRDGLDAFIRQEIADGVRGGFDFAVFAAGFGVRSEFEAVEGAFAAKALPRSRWWRRVSPGRECSTKRSSRVPLKQRAGLSRRLGWRSASRSGSTPPSPERWPPLKSAFTRREPRA